MVFPRMAAAGLILAAAWITPARAELVLFHGTGLAVGSYTGPGPGAQPEPIFGGITMDISYNTDSAAPGGPGSWTVPTLDIELDGGIWAFPGGFDAGISSTITLENEGHGILFDYQRTDLDALGNHDEIEVFLHGGKAWTTLPTDFSGTYGNYWLDYGGGIGQPHWILNGPVTTVPEPSGLVLVLSAMILVTPVILKRSQVD